MVRHLTVFLVFLWVPVASVWAQAGLEVTVYNVELRQPMEGVRVQVVNEHVSLVVEGTTNEQGKVRFAGLTTSGAYEVFVEETEAFHEARASNISLRSNFTRSITLLRFPIQSVELEEVTVTGTASFARINTVNAEVSSTLSEREVQMLPVEGRDVTRALYRLPNVTRATGFYPEAPNVSINGANSLYTNYMIDGMGNNENFLGGQKFAIPIGFTQDVTVLTNNYSTEFGRTGNGVFNITTRSGGNDLSGEVFYLTRPGPALDAASPYPQRDLSGNQVKDGFMRQQIGVAVGGPIMQDKTFFYANVEQTLDFKDNLLTVPDLNVLETIAGRNSFTYASGKIDHKWSSRFKTSLRAHVGLVEIERQGGGLEGGVTFPSAGNTQDRNSTLLALHNTYVGNGLVSESNIQYSRFRWNYARSHQEEGPQVTVLNPQEQTLAVLGHPGYAFDNRENTVQAQQKLTFPRNRHTFKVGADFISSDFRLYGGGNGNGNYLVKLNEQQMRDLAAQNPGSGLDITDIPSDVEVLDYSVELRPNSFGKRQNLFSLYVEDWFSVSSRLNLTLGLRYDYDNLTKGGATKGDLNNIAPRFNFNYALDARSSVRGGYGLFYEKMVYAIYSDALQQNSTSLAYRNQLQQLIDQGLLPSDTDLDRVTFEGNLTVNVPGVKYLQGPTPDEVQDLRETTFSNDRRLFNPNGYQNPYTHQFSLGYQRQIGENTLFYLDLMHTRSFNLYRLRDLNSPTPYTITRDQADTTPPDLLPELVRTKEEADATRPVEIIEGGARNIVISETAGRARYAAASVNVLKERGKDVYAYRLSYTLSRLENDTEDINFRAQDANNFNSEWGPSINDRTHVFSGIVYVYSLKALSLSVAALVQSGQPINRIPDALRFGTTDLNGDGRSFGDAYVGNSDRSPGEARNSDRLPWATTFDLGLQYTVPVRGRFVEFRADIFNLFNAENLSGYSNNATQSNQIQVGPADSGQFVRRNAGAPRQFQFGVRYVF